MRGEKKKKKSWRLLSVSPLGTETKKKNTKKNSTRALGRGEGQGDVLGNALRGGLCAPGVSHVPAAPATPGLPQPAWGGSSQEHGICFQLGPWNA